ncbi:hypothetical protein B14911_11597 [Bacillus sp. NRRL B-14911]|nr:hypothetical protein B14911_11597 [Bacillus sp. NRRL B-14911]
MYDILHPFSDKGKNFLMLFLKRLQ